MEARRDGTFEVIVYVDIEDLVFRSQSDRLTYIYTRYQSSLLNKLYEISKLVKAKGGTLTLHPVVFKKGIDPKYGKDIIIKTNLGDFTDQSFIEIWNKLHNQLLLSESSMYYDSELQPTVYTSIDGLPTRPFVFVISDNAFPMHLHDVDTRSLPHFLLLCKEWALICKVRLLWLGSQNLPSFPFIYYISAIRKESSEIQKQGKRYLTGIYNNLFYSIHDICKQISDHPNGWIKYIIKVSNALAVVLSYWNMLNLDTWFERKYGFSMEKFICSRSHSDVAGQFNDLENDINDFSIFYNETFKDHQKYHSLSDNLPTEFTLR